MQNNGKFWRFASVIATITAFQPAVSAPVTVNIGDTLGVNFRFTEPFTETPNVLSTLFYPTLGNSYSGIFQTTLYDGNSVLSTSAWSSGGAVWSIFRAPDGPWGGYGTADFSSIRDQSIQGKVTATLTSGLSLQYDPALSWATRVEAGREFLTGPNSGSTTPAGTATIEAITLNGSSIYTPPPPPSTQTLYLNFVEGIVPVPQGALNWWSNEVAVYTKPSAGLEPSVEQEIARIIEEEIFSDFRIDVTTTRPTSGEYSTMYIGGSRSDMGEPFASRLAGLLGVAQILDFDNNNKTDVAHVFSAEMGSPTSAGFLESLALVIGHEAAHIFGLQHVTLPGELIYENASGLGSAITNASAQVVATPFGCQNSYQELGRNLGFIVGSPIERDSCENIGRIAGEARAAFDALFLALVYDQDTGPIILDLGNATEFDFPARTPLAYALYGSSTAGGPIDIVSSSLAIDDLNRFSSLNDLSAEELLGTFTGTDFSSLGLFQFVPGIGFSAIGGASLVYTSSVVPEPATILLLALALILVLAFAKPSPRYYRTLFLYPLKVSVR
jgi:hypothetical protein